MQQAIVIELRASFLLSLDDLLVAMRRFILVCRAVRRAGRNTGVFSGRVSSLRRNGASNLPWPDGI